VSQPTYITTTQQQVAVVTSPDETVVATTTSTPVVTATVAGPQGPTGPPGPSGTSDYPAVAGPYTVSQYPGRLTDDLGAGAVGTTGTVTVGSRDNTDTAFPLASYFASVAPGGLLQVWWTGGRRVYERVAGVPQVSFDLEYGLAYQVPVELVYATGPLPAGGTAVRVSVIPAPSPTGLLADLLTLGYPPSDGDTYTLTATDGVLAWVAGTVTPPSGTYSLDFSDPDNSMYIGSVV
jgi:hypothetical protein